MYPSKLELEAYNRDYLHKFVSKEKIKEKPFGIYRGTSNFNCVAYLVGVFPITNTFSAKFAGELKFKPLSWACLYSWIMFTLKWLSIVLIAQLVHQYNAGVKYEKSQVDLYAGVVGLFLVFGLGVLAHFLTCIKVPKFLDVLQSLESYDLKYKTVHFPGSQFFYIKLILGTLLSLVIIVIPAGLILILNQMGKENLVLHLPFGFEVRNPHQLMGVLTVAGFLLEFGTLNLFSRIFGLTAGMTDRLASLVREIKEKSETKVWVLGLKDKTWLDISYQYLEFHNILEKLEVCLSPYLLVMFPAMILASVCTIYYKIKSDSPFASDAGFVLNIGIGICFYRIFALADCGEMLEKKYRHLIRELLKVNQNSKFLQEEKIQFKQLLKLVKTVPVTLSAGGYFTVSRSNVTQISGVILTYIIVLLQFNLTDHGLAGFGNNTKDYTDFNVET